MFWLKKDDRPAVANMGGPANFIIKELNLDKSQQEAYLELVHLHQNEVRSLRNEIRHTKDEFFDLLNHPEATDSIKLIAAKKISKYSEQIDIVTLNHFASLRALCNGQQRQKLGAIMKEVTRMMGPPMPPHNGPPPPPER